jgi:hypothetical protein
MTTLIAQRHEKSLKKRRSIHRASLDIACRRGDLKWSRRRADRNRQPTALTDSKIPTTIARRRKPDRYFPACRFSEIFDLISLFSRCSTDFLSVFSRIRVTTRFGPPCPQLAPCSK